MDIYINMEFNGEKCSEITIVFSGCSWFNSPLDWPARRRFQKKVGKFNYIKYQPNALRCGLNWVHEQVTAFRKKGCLEVDARQLALFPIVKEVKYGCSAA